MATEKISLRRLESRITEEHLRIRSLLDGIQTAADPNVLLPLLRELKSHLESHFDGEEGDEGLHAIIEDGAPHHTDRADRLIAEHGELMARVSRVIHECNQIINGPLRNLRESTREMVARLQAHDVAESELLTDALLRDTEY
jgi:hypothetical protein